MSTHVEVESTDGSSVGDVVTVTVRGGDGFHVLPTGGQLVITKGGKHAAVFAPRAWLNARIVQDEPKLVGPFFVDHSEALAAADRFTQLPRHVLRPDENGQWQYVETLPPEEG